MYRRLQVNSGKVFNAQNTVKVDMKRGTFVNESYDTTNKITTLIKAVKDENVLGILTRDVVVDIDVAMGVPVSDYSKTQDIIGAGELAGVETIQKGERYATELYVATLTDTDVVEDTLITVINGELAKLPSGQTTSTFKSLGWKYDAGHKLLGFKLV